MSRIARVLRTLRTHLDLRCRACSVCHTADVDPLASVGTHLAEDDSMKRADLPLLLASDMVGSSRGRFPLDPVRMQKAIFLLTQRGSDTWQDLYTYRPYNWGPYSGQLSVDLDVLQATDQLVAEPFPGSQYGTFRATPLAEKRVREAWAACSQPEQSFLRTVRAYVTSKSFNALLREVYAAYPQYASKSLFNG